MKDTVHAQGMALGMVVEEDSSIFPIPYTKKGGNIHFQLFLELSFQLTQWVFQALCRCFIQKSFITWSQGSSLLGALIFFLQMAHLVSWNILTSHTFPFLSEELWTLESMVSNLCHKPNGGEIQLIAKDGSSVLSLTLLWRCKYGYNSQ